MCGFCDVDNKYQKPLDLFSDEEIEAYILAVYYGVITVENLDINAFLKVARKLFEGVENGYGSSLFEVSYASDDYYMLKALQENVYVFSGAKQYQQVREMSRLLTKDGKIRTFAEFKKSAKEIFTKYNEAHLQVEYNSAIAQARTASQWQDIQNQKEQFPMLTYQTVGDMRVRPTHAALDNISRPVDDKFWNFYMPPNGWNCRCHVEQNDENEETDLKDFKHPEDVPDIFMFNAGKDRIVFSPKHPYFNVAGKDKANAKVNWGMPIV